LPSWQSFGIKRITEIVHCEVGLELCLEQDFDGRRIWCWVHRILYAQDSMVGFSQIFLIGKSVRKA
jgi:hypothetical protein